MVENCAVVAGMCVCVNIKYTIDGCLAFMSRPSEWKRTNGRAGRSVDQIDSTPN